MATVSATLDQCTCTPFLNCTCFDALDNLAVGVVDLPFPLWEMVYIVSHAFC